ncbi:Ganglioside-induced differentiation-associated protein 1 [Seminavis robusta]|uniref:Ganglioside-induced differentiation-associated protein 1 n=1 Tax=Seminavis robusta TaxID=568900 RepID=A0A9N8DXC3_9STRA|nr:Ganglioside-induced differentiation-associated protein 1 [Seminavis robusta]|eukprot:Sro417_g138740.1 Ganglioside-induced differentiation-associated protein 1 (330) ;mRNA; f:44492-45481
MKVPFALVVSLFFGSAKAWTVGRNLAKTKSSALFAASKDMELASPSSTTVVTLYDSVNSYYAGVARMALCENDVHFQSRYVNMPQMEQLEPWYLRIDPKGQIPSLTAAGDTVLTESRDIVRWGYGSDETQEEAKVLDQLYSECPGSLAWLSGSCKILLLKVIARSPAKKIVLPKKIRRYQKQEPDLFDVYEDKLAAMSQKHFSKDIGDVQKRIQAVVDWLEDERTRNGGEWLLGDQFGRADAVTTVYLNWIVHCNDVGAAPIAIPKGLLKYLEKAKARKGFEEAIGQYGDDAFVLTMIRQKNRKAGRVLGVVSVIGMVQIIRKVIGVFL